MKTVLSLSLSVTLCLCCCSPKPKPPAAKMADPAIADGLAELTDPLHDCAERHKVNGYAQVKMKIEADGSVSSVELGKRFGGTPAGACVEKVIAGGRFVVKNGPLIIRYPVLVR